MHGAQPWLVKKYSIGLPSAADAFAAASVIKTKRRQAQACCAKAREFPIAFIRSLHGLDVTFKFAGGKTFTRFVKVASLQHRFVVQTNGFRPSVRPNDPPSQHFCTFCAKVAKELESLCRRSQTSIVKTKLLATVGVADESSETTAKDKHLDKKMTTVKTPQSFFVGQLKGMNRIDSRLC